MAAIRIGTSGWHYKHWIGKFYPAKLPAAQMLAYYLERFNTVEINNSFYMLPKFETMRCWRAATPKNFEFAVKASRFLTHNKKLKEPENALQNFLPRAEALEEKLGPILFQLPPRWRVNVERLEEFLQVLPRRHRYAFEFREPSWNTQAVYATLRRHNAAYCIFELDCFISPLEITADFAYVRLHGPGGKYQGCYSRQTLRQWAERVAAWNKLRAAYIYFDNDQAGYAAQNALELKRLVAERRSKSDASEETKLGAA